MTPFVPTTRPYEADFFSLYTENGKRYIHIHGYSYESYDIDYESDDNPNGVYWPCTDCRWLIVDLADFIDGYKAGESEYIDELLQGTNQNQWALTGEQMTDAINHYYGKAPDAVVDYAEITMSTPDGDYITPEITPKN